MTAVDRGPTRLCSAVAVVAAVVAFVVSGPYAWAALVVGALGAVLVVAGVVVGSHAAVTTGSAGLFVAVVAAGLRGIPPSFVLVGTVATIVAWDAGGTAIDLGAQLGRAADTARLELVHTASTAIVGTLAAGASWLLYRVGFGGRSLTVPMLLLIAALCIAVALTIRAR